MTATRILLVDDEAYVRESLAEILAAEGYRIEQADSGRSALELARAERPHVVITDLKMPDRSGLTLLTDLRQAGCAAPVILITGAGSVTDAVAAMRAGAFDFLLKPIDPAQLVVQVERALAHGQLVDEVEYLRQVARGRPAPRTLAGGSEIMAAVRAAIEQVAPTDVPVLLTGESGTGKEVAAEIIHAASSRKQRPFVTVNCAAIPEALFESECFGHVRGAFSGAFADRVGRFAEAHEGTLFLDEVGTLGLDVQAKLLRVLETGEYQVVGESRARTADVRIVAATNEDLRARVEEGRFRADLYYRLDVFPIELPPLRRHREDLPEIAAELSRRALRGRLGVGSTDESSGFTLSAEALEVLGGYDWPGNVRELRNVLERATIAAGGQTPGAALLRDILESGLRQQPAEPTGTGESGLSLRAHLDKRERELLQEALARTQGRKKEAAQLLGIDPRNLAYYLRKHGLAEDGDGSRRP